MDEHNLIELAKSGDQEAFRALVETHQAMVYNLAFRMVANAEDAADLTQEVFLSVWRNLSSFQGKSAFSTWLYRLTTNAAIDFLRKEKHRNTVSITVEDEEGEHELDVPDETASPQQELERKELREAVREGLARLSPDHRQILLLREMEGLSYQEIADVLDLEEGTVKSRIARARLALRDYLQKTGNFSPGEPS